MNRLLNHPQLGAVVLTCLVDADWDTLDASSPSLAAAITQHFPDLFIEEMMAIFDKQTVNLPSRLVRQSDGYDADWVEVHPQLRLSRFTGLTNAQKSEVLSRLSALDPLLFGLQSAMKVYHVPGCHDRFRLSGERSFNWSGFHPGTEGLQNSLRGSLDVVVPAAFAELDGVFSTTHPHIRVIQYTAMLYPFRVLGSPADSIVSFDLSGLVGVRFVDNGFGTGMQRLTKLALFSFRSLEATGLNSDFFANCPSLSEVVVHPDDRIWLTDAITRNQWKLEAVGRNFFGSCASLIRIDLCFLGPKIRTVAEYFLGNCGTIKAEQQPFVIVDNIAVLSDLEILPSGFMYRTPVAFDLNITPKVTAIEINTFGLECRVFNALRAPKLKRIDVSEFSPNDLKVAFLHLSLQDRIHTVEKNRHSPASWRALADQLSAVRACTPACCLTLLHVPQLRLAQPDVGETEMRGRVLECDLDAQAGGADVVVDWGRLAESMLKESLNMHCANPMVRHDGCFGGYGGGQDFLDPAWLTGWREPVSDAAAAGENKYQNVDRPVVVKGELIYFRECIVRALSCTADANELWRAHVAGIPTTITDLWKALGMSIEVGDTVAVMGCTFTKSECLAKSLV